MAFWVSHNESSVGLGHFVLHSLAIFVRPGCVSGFPVVCPMALFEETNTDL